MNLFGTVLALCNCLLLGASLAQARASTPAKAAFDVSTLGDSVTLDARSDIGQSIRDGSQKLNCQLLLRRESVDCSGLSSKACTLVDWIHKGCQKQAKCATKTGSDAKRCCDDEERLPFGGGVYYTGYLRACAPQYEIKRFDRPQFPDRPCNANHDCRFGISKWLCDMRGWEQAGCHQRRICDNPIRSGKQLHECCRQWPNTPQGFFSTFYQHRFNLKCPQQAEGRLSVTKSSSGDVIFRYMGIEAAEGNEIRVFKVHEAPVHTGEKPSSVGWIMVKNEKGMVKLSSFSKNKLKPGKKYTAVVLRRSDYDWLTPPVNFTMPWDGLPAGESSNEILPGRNARSNEGNAH